MPQNMPKWGIMLMVAVIAAWVGGWGTPAFADAPMERTGQTQCWDPADTSFPIEEIACSDPAATGQDGAVLAGHPLPTPRFVDEGNGTVEDKLTDLIWLKDASGLGAQTWGNALGAVADLNEGEDFSCADYTAGTFADWRLPNVKELQSLIHFGFFNPALSNAAGTDKWTEGNAFSGVQSRFYWSSTTRAGNPDFAWDVYLNDAHLRRQQGRHHPCVAGPGGSRIDSLTL
jgi:Protein of unknown function (DUF1566)